MKTNKEYKDAALSALKGNWAQAVVATCVILIFSEIISVTSFWLNPVQYSWIGAAMPVLAIFVVLPLAVGYANAFNALYMMSDRQVVGSMKDLTCRHYLRNLAGMFLMALFVWLWTLLLIVPGIIMSYAWFLVPYLLVDNPELSLMETLSLSRKMMRGNKWRLFKLQLSFIGWILLNVLTLGIASLWVMPYMMTAMSAFYQDVKAEFITNK